MNSIWHFNDTKPDTPCPVCSNIAFFSNDFPGSYVICHFCDWEDDDLQYDDHNYAGGANKISLNQAKNNYKLYGCIYGKK